VLRSHAHSSSPDELEGVSSLYSSNIRGGPAPGLLHAILGVHGFPTQTHTPRNVRVRPLSLSIAAALAADPLPAQPVRANMQLNLLALLALLIVAVFASAAMEGRDLVDCAPHPKMSQADCKTCIKHGAKLHWVGTAGPNGKGKGGCQYRNTATGAPTSTE